LARTRRDIMLKAVKLDPKTVPSDYGILILKTAVVAAIILADEDD
jgi:hypothetical protein